MNTETMNVIPCVQMCVEVTPADRRFRTTFPFHHLNFMTRSLSYLLLAAVWLAFLAGNANAGSVVEPDTTDQIVLQSGLNSGYYFTLYSFPVGRLLQSSDMSDAVEAFPLPYLAPGQQVTGATVSFFLQSLNGTPTAKLQLYGLNRVSATNSTPIPADYYVGTNDTANTLLDASFITPTSTPNSAITYSGANLTSFIQKQYANTAFTGMDFSQTRYMFLRVGPDKMDSGYTNYVLGNSRTLARNNHPTVSFTISNGLTNVAGRLQFSFNLPTAAITSAGVYNPSTGVLIRTLWNNVQYQAGMNYGAWDGNDDSGAAVASGSSYQIKLIYHNVQYIWDGTVGNTSTVQTGYGVYRSNNTIYGMAIAGGNAYYSVCYNEMSNPFHKFVVGTPQTSLEATNAFVQDPYSNIVYVAADASRSYWAKCAGGLSGSANTYIVSVNADGSFYTFPKGTKPSGQNQNMNFTSCCDYDATANQPNPATGLAVQQSGNDLFVAHSNLNLVRVFDKVQGSSLGSFAVTSPTFMATTANGDVWVASNTTPPTLKRYTFANGAATVKATITGLVAPLGVGVSTDDSLVFVTDGGTSQQIKVFNNSTGASQWTYGLPGGMQVNGPNVVNNDFDFGVMSYVAFQSDGTFWVGDGGTKRHIHFRYSGSTVTYIEEINYIPISYDAAADPNVPTRVINRFQEHTVNYSLPLGGTNGSWKLVKDWSYGLPSDATHLYTGFQDGIKNVVTLSNNHTYALMRNFATSKSDLFELPATGFARPTGYSYDDSARIYEDGTLRFNANTGTSMSFYSAPLTGFDTTFNPKWGSPALLATSAIGATDPQSWIGTFPERTEVTSSGMVVDFDPNQNHTGFHLGAIATGGTSFKWRTSPSTTGTYTGWFPQSGKFDIGNGTQYAGDVAMAMGSNVIYGYHGEFWRNGEASQWVNYLDNGLMVGRFGTYANASMGTQVSLDGFTGNGYSPSLVKVNGQVFMYTNDESNHGGTVRWRINGWDGITTQMATGTLGAITSLSSGASGPVVSITSPTPNGNYYNGRAITLSASASSTSGAAVTSVQFFDGSTSLGTATSDPFTINYSGLTAGSHSITATATDANNKTATSAAVSITVGADGSSTPAPAPASLAGVASTSNVALTWTQPTTSTTSSTTGQLLSFQFDHSSDTRALLPTVVGGAPGYAVDNVNAVNNQGVTIQNLGMKLEMVLSNDNGSVANLTGSAVHTFAAEASTAYDTATGMSFYAIPYGVYDLVVYSLPGNISSGTQTASVTVSNNTYSTTVNQTFTAMPTTYTVASIAFGSSTSVTNMNTIVIRGMTSPTFKLQGNNIAAIQLVQRPYDQGIATSYSIERATGTSGTFAQIGTATGSATGYIDSSVSSGVTYQYRIQALDSFGASPYSNTATVTTSGTSTGSTSTGSTSTGSTSTGSTSTGSTSTGSTSTGSTSTGSTSTGSTSTGSTSTGSTSTGSTSTGSTSTGSTSTGSTSTGSTSTGSTSTTQTGFQKWQIKYFTAAQLTDATVSGPSADPYGSGVPNLLAYALQLNPATARPTDVPHANLVNGHLTMAYVSPTAITDVTYLVEVSTDLITWHSGTGYTQVASTVTASTGNTITVSDALPTTTQKRFMRLLVTQK
jgi:Bacterial Ig domain